MVQLDLFKRHQKMHKNSLECYHNSKEAMGKRARLVLYYVKERGACTDREIMQGLGFNDPNSCRPRVTELIQSGKLIEVDSIADMITHKKVRRVKAV